jgi:hypothetical protein
MIQYIFIYIIVISVKNESPKKSGVLQYIMLYCILLLGSDAAIHISVKQFCINEF